jgi:F-type H+-transporting ATPase subunit epsilon
MSELYTLRIVTHQEKVFDGQVESMVAPGIVGYLGVLGHHAPLLTMLTKGLVTVRDQNEKMHQFQIEGGILEVSHNQATILTDASQEIT